MYWQLKSDQASIDASPIFWSADGKSICRNLSLLNNFDHDVINSVYHERLTEINIFMHVTS